MTDVCRVRSGQDMLFWWPRTRPSVRSRPDAGTTVWGDGLEDLSLTSLWYPCSWNDVSEDELLLLIPSLIEKTGSRSAANGVESRAVALLRNAFYARLRHVAITYALTDPDASGASTGEARERANRLRRVLDKNVQEGEPFERLLEHATSHHDEQFSPARRRHRKWRGRPGWSRHDGGDLGSMFDLECTVLGLIASMLNAARLRFGDAGPHPAAFEEQPKRGVECPTLPQATLAAIHTSFNPAYLYPQLIA